MNSNEDIESKIKHIQNYVVIHNLFANLYEKAYKSELAEYEKETVVILEDYIKLIMKHEIADKVICVTAEWVDTCFGNKFNCKKCPSCTDTACSYTNKLTELKNAIADLENSNEV